MTIATPAKPAEPKHFSKLVMDTQVLGRNRSGHAAAYGLLVVRQALVRHVDACVCV